MVRTSADGPFTRTEPSISEGGTKMTETAYEVRISVWNLDVENKDHKMTDFREFSDKDAAYRFSELWTNTFEKYIREGKKMQYKIDITRVERNTYRYSGGSY